MSNDRTRSTDRYLADGLELSYERAQLLIEAGPDEGLEFPLLERPVIIGRGREADLKLTDSSVSRQHAMLQPVEGGWRLRDLDSRSGTWINGTQVDAAPVSPESRIRIGNTEILFTVTSTVMRSARHELKEFEGLLGASEAMSRLFGLVKKVAALGLPVLLNGESGTGKESLARAIHQHGSTRSGPYEVVDCTLLDREHLRSELYGHKKGAFTGAERERVGAFERADGGTIFLDEIGEIPIEMQPTLLRVLEEGEVRALGGDKTKRVRTRVVSATNRDLGKLVEEGRFRADLYYRLSAITLEIPPLRERDEDSVLLARHFLLSGHELSAEAEGLIAAHTWPGNVRELVHCIQRACGLSDGPTIRGDDLLLSAAPTPPSEAPMDPAPATSGGLALGRGAGDPSGRSMAEIEEQAIREAMARFGGSRKKVAEHLGIGRTTLWRKLKKLGLD